MVRAFALCEQYGYQGFSYDADGLGAGVRGYRIASVAIFGNTQVSE